MWFLFSSPLNIVPFFAENAHAYKVTLILLSVGIAFVNWHIVINSGAGSQFVKDFRSIARSKKIALYATAVGITIFAGFLFYISGSMHRHAVGVE